MSRTKKRFTVEAGRSICRDGKHLFTVSIDPGVCSPCEGDELTHIIAACLNRLGQREIQTTYLVGEGKVGNVLRLRAGAGVPNLGFKCPSCGSDPDVDCICKGQNR